MPVDDSRSLAQLLPHLASLLADVPLDAPVAVGVVLPPECDFAWASTTPAVEFFFRHLDCTDVVCALGGFVAPADWHAFGVVAPGRRMLLDHPPSALDDDVTVCALLDRSGLVASEVHAADGEVISQGISSGRAIDACRRVLGLGTAPPQLGPHVWRTLRWVDRVLAAVLDADLGDPPSWPALAALRMSDEPTRRWRENSRRARREPAEWSWHELRDACADQELEVPGIDPEAAAWMDDGLFSREAVAAFAPLVQSLGDLRQLLPQRTFDKLIEQVSDQLAA